MQSSANLHLDRKTSVICRVNVHLKNFGYGSICMETYLEPLLGDLRSAIHNFPNNPFIKAKHNIVHPDKIQKKNFAQFPLLYQRT